MKQTEISESLEISVHSPDPDPTAWNSHLHWKTIILSSHDNLSSFKTIATDKPKYISQYYKYAARIRTLPKTTIYTIHNVGRQKRSSNASLWAAFGRQFLNIFNRPTNQSVTYVYGFGQAVRFWGDLRNMLSWSSACAGPRKGLLVLVRWCMCDGFRV